MRRSIRRFAAELKRRKVYRVAVVYALVAFAVWQVADIAFPSLGLPPLAIRMVLLATILAFPLALVLAWANEVSPDRVSSTVMDPMPASRSGGPAIAVLPFANLSADLGGQHFADGLVEELINALAQIRGLRVVARTSSFRFRDAREDIREIGRALGVSHLVEGSTRHSEDRLRVTAQLIDAEDGCHLWSERFEQTVGELFQVQDEIVAAVTTSLLSRLPAREEERACSRAIIPEAYDAYLRARSAQMELDPESLTRATKLYDTALAHDPSFALAHAGLAEALLLLAGGFGAGPPQAFVRRARSSIEHALELAPHLPEAHVARANLLLFHAWEHEEARQELERALELSPSSLEAHMTFEMYHTYVHADHEAALRMATRACELSPVDPRPRLRLGYVHAFAGRFNQAVAVFRRLVEAGIVQGPAALGLADTLLRVGRTEEAVQWARRGLAAGAPSDTVLAQAGGVLVQGGRSGEAMECLRELERRGTRGATSHFWIGVLLVALGRSDEGFEHLDRAVLEHDPSLLYLSVVPFPGVRSDARYAGILERIGVARLASGIGAVYPSQAAATAAPFG